MISKSASSACLSCLATDYHISPSLGEKEFVFVSNEFLSVTSCFSLLRFLRSLRPYSNTCPHHPPVSSPPLNRCGLAQTVALGECFMRRQIRIFFKAPSISSQKFYRNWKSHYGTPFQQQNEAKICSDKFPNKTQLAVFRSIYGMCFSLTHT